jgi:hypothetical protein
MGMRAEVLDLRRAQAEGSALKPRPRSAVIQALEFSYELSVRSLRRHRRAQRRGAAHREPVVQPRSGSCDLLIRR